MVKRFLLLIFFFVIALLVINYTSAEEALVDDASTYLRVANETVKKQALFSSWITPGNRFVDYGYPFSLGVLISIKDDIDIRAIQSINYIYHLLSSYYIYKSLRHLVDKKSANVTAAALLLSPIYLSFSSKLYSEPFASLGTSLLTYGIVSQFRNRATLTNTILYVIGGAILYSVKSVFLLIPIIILMFSAVKKKWLLFVATLLTLTLIHAQIISSMSGGRSLYNLSIQTEKLNLSYDVLTVCAIYNLSYPTGVILFPSYQGYCHQNDPDPSMPGYQFNPYLIGITAANSGLVTWKTVVESIISNPIKYGYIMLTSMTSIIFFEGVYPGILFKLPSTSWGPIYLVLKVFLSLMLWYLFAIGVKYFRALILPLLYFLVVVSNFPMEQRYIYPLIPYIYMVAGYGLSRIKYEKNNQ